MLFAALHRGSCVDAPSPSIDSPFRLLSRGIINAQWADPEIGGGHNKAKVIGLSVKSNNAVPAAVIARANIAVKNVSNNGARSSGAAS